MTRPSAMEVSRRGSARDQPVRTSSSDSDRPKVGKSSKSPRGVPPNQSQKKLGTRIANLESQLGLAHEELKCLKDQLASTETAKKAAAQGQFERKKPFEINEKHSAAVGTNGSIGTDSSDAVEHETDVSGVSIEKVSVEEPKVEEHKPLSNEHEVEPKAVGVSPELMVPEDPSVQELAMKDNEIQQLKGNITEKDAEMEAIRKENERLKSQLDEKSVKITSTESEINELTSRLSKVLQELEESKTSMSQMNERLEGADKAREELENEMTKLRVQTEQWRKAADAAAAVLAGGVEMNGRRISERCGSMDTNVFERVGGYASYVGSPGMNDDCDYGFGSDKRKGSAGIRMLGELWRKKGQK